MPPVMKMKVQTASARTMPTMLVTTARVAASPTAEALRPDLVIGIGAFARDRCLTALGDAFPVGRIPKSVYAKVRRRYLAATEGR